MHTELPDLLSVLAHELRSPLSVLQGYVRLLQRQRDPGDPESTMLASMLDATGRLAAIGRHASDLASWLRRGPVPLAPVPVRTVLADIASRSLAGWSVAEVPAEVGSVEIGVADPALLAGAIVAVGDLAMRDSGQKAVALDVQRAPAAPDGLSLLLRPAGSPAAVDESAAATPTDVAFDRGGLGLTLVLASYILEAHGARVTTAAAGPHVVWLPLARGSA
jgi:signal transduction histidine kinase